MASVAGADCVCDAMMGPVTLRMSQATTASLGPVLMSTFDDLGLYNMFFFKVS